MILQRVIKKSESVVNGLKLSLWGSTYSLKRLFNERKKEGLHGHSLQQELILQSGRSQRHLFVPSLAHITSLHCV